MKKAKTKSMWDLSFDDQTDKFPHVWDADEEVELSNIGGDITATISLDPIINKHVWLALKDYFTEASFTISSYAKKSPVDICLFAELVKEAKTIHHESLEHRDNLEERVKELIKEEFWDGNPEEVGRIIACFRKCADLMEKYKQGMKEKEPKC
jgi:hypothetical protein